MFCISPLLTANNIVQIKSDHMGFMLLVHLFIFFFIYLVLITFLDCLTYIHMYIYIYIYIHTHTHTHTHIHITIKITITITINTTVTILKSTPMHILSISRLSVIVYTYLECDEKLAAAKMAASTSTLS